MLTLEQRLHWRRYRRLRRRDCYASFRDGQDSVCAYSPYEAGRRFHRRDSNPVRSMQLQGELQVKGNTALHYRGPVHGVRVIVGNEGIRAIYRGLGCAYVYQILLNGCRLGFYEPMRNTLSNLLYSNSTVQSLPINMFCGATSGMLGAAAGSPFFLVKTRLQSFSTNLPVGTQHNYRNAIDGLSKIYRGEGIRGLYRGVGAAMIRTGFGSSVQLPTYFFAKRRLMRHAGMEEGPALHLTSSAVSGFVVCCFMHPPGTLHQNWHAFSGPANILVSC